jgi:hypothetical protein
LNVDRFSQSIADRTYSTVNHQSKQSTLSPATDNDKLVTIGYTERDQLLLFLSHSDLIDNTTASYTGHNVSVTAINITTLDGLQAVVIRLHDDVTPMSRMRGGNSFHAMYKGHSHRQVCAYVDYVDDIYDVICRLYDACADVSVHVTYVNYGAYRWDGEYVNKIVYSGKVCVKPPASTILKNLTITNSKLSKIRRPIANDVRHSELKWQRRALWNWSDTSRTYYAGWYVLDNRRRDGALWLSNSGQVLPTDEQMVSCLEALPSPIEFIGESHLRYAYNDLLQRISNSTRTVTLGKLKTHFTLDKYVFSYGGYAVDHSQDIELLNDLRGILPRFKVFTNHTWTIKDNPQNVQTELHKWSVRERERASVNGSRSASVRRRLIISFGTWDTHNINIKYFVSKALPMIRQFFELRQSDAVLSQVKVIITTTPAVREYPYMDSQYPTAHSCLRNNALLAAANRLLVDTVQMFDDVSVVDWFGITAPYTEQARDLYHYVWEQDPLKLSPTGVAMTRLLIQAVCKQ